MFTYLWNDIYENLVVKSVGLNLFSLLVSSSSSSVDASSFGYVVILSLYLVLNFVISSLIVGTFGVYIYDFVRYIYHGAFTIAWRTSFWYLCNISMFELLAVSQRGIPYVQILDTWSTKCKVPFKSYGNVSQWSKESEAFINVCRVNVKVIWQQFLLTCISRFSREVQYKKQWQCSPFHSQIE